MWEKIENLPPRLCRCGRAGVYEDNGRDYHPRGHHPSSRFLCAHHWKELKETRRRRLGIDELYRHAEISGKRRSERRNSDEKRDDGASARCAAPGGFAAHAPGLVVVDSSDYAGQVDFTITDGKRTVIDGGGRVVICATRGRTILRVSYLSRSGVRRVAVGVPADVEELLRGEGYEVV